MRHEAEAWELLQTKLVAVMGSYLVAQVKAGASALQIFDSWAGSLRLEEFQRFELPYLKQLCSFVRSRTDVPLVYFSLNSSHLFSAIKDCGAAVFGVDWRVSLKEAAQHLGSVPLQGNLNPELLLGPWEVAQPEVQRILGEGRSLPGFVFNLGHGILPKTPLENVQKLVESVRGL
jgi:uroporphyrinogen decarboxylase